MGRYGVAGLQDMVVSSSEAATYTDDRRLASRGRLLRPDDNDDEAFAAVGFFA